MITESQIDQYHLDAKKLLAKKFGKRKFDRRIRTIVKSLRLLLGSDEAGSAFLSTAGDDGYPIGDNPDFILAIDSVTPEFGVINFDLHDLRKIMKKLEAYPEIQRAFALAVLGAR